MPLAIGIAILAIAIGSSLSIRESLWIDELHSAWVIADDWGEIAHRAALGNQSPLYFYGLKAWSETAATILPRPATDAMLRLSSLVIWMILCSIVFFLIAKKLPPHARLQSVIIVGCWLFLDRIGAFYAIELRPYICVALGGLLVMLAGAKLTAQPNRIGIWWLLASTSAFYFHYTSMIVILCSWAGIIMASVTRWNTLDRVSQSRIVRFRAVDGILLILMLAPGLWQLQQISYRSGQWASFAGDASLVNLVDLLPWLFWTSPPLAVLAIEWRSRIRKVPHHLPVIAKPSTQKLSYEELELAGMWWQMVVIGLGTPLLIWMVTYLEWAPLMHRRYTMGAYPALLLLGAYLVGRIRTLFWCAVAGVLSVSLMIWWQGTATEWRSGRWIAWQRQEDWRGAIAFLNVHQRTDEKLFLAPMLIETRGAVISPAIDSNYLRYPLTSLYPIIQSDLIRLLPNDRSHWATGMIPELATARAQSAWIIARLRGSTSLETELRALSGVTAEAGPWIIEHVFYGGGVQIWKLRRR